MEGCRSTADGDHTSYLTSHPACPRPLGMVMVMVELSYAYLWSGSARQIYLK